MSKRYWIIASVCLAMFPVLLYVGLDALGRFVLQGHITEWEAKGEIFDVEKLIPPPVPDEENMAMTPVVRYLMGDTMDVPEEWLELGEVDIRNVEGFDLDNYSSSRSPKPPSYFGARVTTDWFPESLPEPEIHTRIISYSDAFEPIWDKLSVEGKKKQKLRLNLEYEKGFKMQFTNLQSFMDHGKLLKERSVALLDRDEEKAKSSLSALYQLERISREAPLLISNLISTSLSGMRSSVIHEGLIRGSWSDQSLKDFSNLENCTTTGVEAGYLNAIRYDRAVLIETLRTESKSELFGYLGSNPAWLSVLIPRGYFEANAAEYSAIFQRTLLSDDQGIPSHDRIPVEWRMEEERDKLDNKAFRALFYKLLLQSLPSYDSITERLLRNETYRRQTLIAIRLEQHKRQHGSYPVTLSKVPSLSPELIHDRFANAPMRYFLEADGSYVLYSIGINGTDDGGLMKRDREEGDWVFRLKLPEDFDYDEYRSK